MATKIDMNAARPIADMQVLIADDDRDGADVLAELIRIELGCKVVVAYDGATALELVLSQHHDVLILDLQMPGQNGLDIARYARSTASEGRIEPPLLLAMTGRKDLVRDLTMLDVRFDRAFAKPVDFPTLVATLRTRWQGGSTAQAQAQAQLPVEFRLFDTLTQAARRALPMMTARGQQLSFDAEGPELVVQGDEVAMLSAFYRLMCAAHDLIGSGIVLVLARSAADESGAQTLTVNIAGSGQLQTPSRMAEVLQRLAVAHDAAGAIQPDFSGLVRARGACPNSGGELSFLSYPSDGVLLRLELRVHPTRLETPPQVDRARAWIVDPRHVEPAVLQRRLQRLGWRVQRFASVTEASTHVNALNAEDRPELLLVHEDAQTLPSSQSASAARSALRSQMPDRTRCLLLIEAGAAAPKETDAMPRWNLRVEPLSPGEISELARSTLATPDAHGARADHAADSHSLGGRRNVLVVDDNEVNRIVACGMLQVLGYEAAAVADGLDAIEHCKLMPPDAVLMDVDMPVLGGVDASRHIVELQKSGRMAPFAIIAATADSTHQTRTRCYEAGVSGYLTKPLLLQAMREELRRVGVPAAAD